MVSASVLRTSVPFYRSFVPKSSQLTSSMSQKWTVRLRYNVADLLVDGKSTGKYTSSKVQEISGAPIATHVWSPSLLHTASLHQ